TPHRGIGPNVLRAHFGLICPEGCRFRVGSEERRWRDGEFLVFDDTLDHEAWNESDRPRVVFHIDFFHPPGQDTALMAAQARVLRETNIRGLIA
ncbi:aspartyl/asparaginyl beta-hydroxylase domain-containing protein, partial [Acinetobacter baumannii]